MDSGCVRIFWCDPRGRIRWQLGSVRVTLAAVGWALLLRWSWGGTSFPGASTSSQAHCSFSRDQATPSHHQHCSTAAGHQHHCSVNIITGVVVWYLYAADVLKWQLGWRVETRLEELVPGGGWAIWHWHWYRLSFESGWCWWTTVCQDPCSAALDIVRVKCCDREQFSLTMFRVAGPRTLAWLLGWVAPPSASSQQLQHAVTVPGLASQQQHGSSGSLEHGKCGKLKSYFSDSFEYISKYLQPSLRISWM